MLAGFHDHDPHIEKLIDQLVEATSFRNNKIEGLRPASSEHQQDFRNEVNKVEQRRGRPLLYPYLGSGAGRGPFVELMDGSVKLDLINGIGIHLLGHGHPEVIRASIRGALSDVANQGNLQPNLEYSEMIGTVLDLARPGSRLKYGWLSTCGTMANESALKIARQKKSPARMVIGFKDAFAGRSTLMAELTDNPAYRQGLPEYHEVLRIPWFDYRDPRSGEKSLVKLKEYAEKYLGQLSVFVFEPMLGEGGYMPAPREFFLPLLSFCKELGIPVWADEVQTFCRTREPFAFQTLGLGDWIDIVTIAKTAQVGMTLYSEEMNPKPGLIAGTFSGSSVALKAGLAIFKVMKEGYFWGEEGRIQKIHHRMVGGLRKLGETTCAGKLADATGMGLMIAFTPLDGKKETVDILLKKFFEKGLIVFSCGKSPVRIRMLVPAIIQDQEIDLALKIIEEVLIEGV